MLPCLPIPRSVTVLYVFSILNLMALLNLTLVDADLIILDRENRTIEELSDLPAAFGPSIPNEGFWGHVKIAQPLDACSKVLPPTRSINSTDRWIALIQREGCQFDEKVLNAQKAGYAAAIVHNLNSDKLLTMHGNEYVDEINITSVFISQTDGLWMKKLIQQKDVFSVIIDNHEPLNPNLYLLPFAIVVGVCFIVMVIFMVVKWVMSIRSRQRSRLSKANLNKIPTKKFKKGDPYDCCAICLDDYEEGDKLRILPCAHAYHQKCVDPWLTKNKKTCPLCKKKVIPGEPDTSSEEEDSDDDSGGESTPLLGGRNNRSRGGTFAPSGHRNNANDVDSDGSSYSDYASPSTSQVEVHHHAPQVHRSRPDYSAVEMTESSTDSSSSEEELGAVGGAPAQELSIVEDHFDDRRRKKKSRSPQKEQDPEKALEVCVVGSIQEHGPNSSSDEHA